MLNSYWHSNLNQEENHELKGLKKVSRRSKTGLMVSSTKAKPSKPPIQDIISESPYAQIQGLQKNRSASRIKLKLPSKLHASYLNTTDSSTTLNKTKMNSSSISSLQFTDSLPKQRNLSSHSSFKGSKLIEDRLAENLKKLKEKSIGTEKLEPFRHAFNEIIEKDEEYGGLLKKIKEAYEYSLKNDQSSSVKDLSSKLKELDLLKEKLLAFKQEKKYLVQKIEKLAKENVELSRNLDDRDKRYVDLQDKLLKLSKFDLDNVPLDEKTWKFLCSENEHLVRVCEEMRQDIKNLSHKEKKLVKLIVALKNRGYPVEDVYQEDVHHQKKEKFQNCDEPMVDDSENEDLLSGRPITVKKPEFIPTLNLNEVEVSQDSMSSSDTSFKSN